MSIPGSGSPLLLASTAAAAADAAYVIPKSLRFNSGDSAHLSKTFASAGNRRTWTWSGWIKKCVQGSYQKFFFGGTTSDEHGFRFENTDQLSVYRYSGSFTFQVKTTRVFRDPSAFFHLVVAYDSTQATASNRVKIYINGVQETDFATSNYPSQNSEYGINNTVEQSIGRLSGAPSSEYFNGLIADIQFVDGQQLAASDFGETRSSDGVWVPKEFTRTSPNNGTTWSSDLTATSSGAYFATGAGAADAFDGNLDNSAQSEPNGSTITWSPTGGITVGTSLRVYRGSDSTSSTVNISVNGGSSQSFARSSWVDLSFTGTLTSLAVSSPSANPGLSAVEVDGEILLDDFNNSSGYGRNGFHLNFSDSSTNEALGFDSAPTTPDPDPKKGFDVITYTGNGGTQNIGGLGFEPGLIWLKRRNASAAHALFDSIRGVTKVLESSNTGAEKTNDPALASFNPDGFSLNTSSGQINASSATYVAWMWKAGGPAVSNTDGSVTSQVSANNDYGFSIVKYTMGGSDITVGHGLSTEPKWIITRRFDNTDSWIVYHASLGKTKYLFLNGNNAAFTDTADAFTSTSSSVFDARQGLINAGDCIAYCWSEVSGFSKFGSYAGSGASGKQVTGLGFKPRYLLVKAYDANASWVIVDSERGGDKLLFAEATNADSAGDDIIFLDDGFQIQGGGGDQNYSGRNYVYMAFADRPGNNWDVNNIVTNEGLTTSKQNFDVVTYTGNGGTQKIGGTVYSDGWSGSINSTNGAAASFDGNDSTFTRSEISATATWTAATSIPFTTLRLRGAVDSGNGTIQVNGVDVTSQFTANSATLNTQTISGVTSPLTSIKLIGNASSQPRIAFVEIDGTVLLDGNGPGLKFQPDFVWIKPRSPNAQNHFLYDSVRGAGRSLRSSTTADEKGPNTGTDGDLRSFDANGFTLGSGAGGTGSGAVNNNNESIVAWCWKAGGTAVSNTDGAVTASVSANAAYGFSIVKWTSTSTSGTESVGHGLGKRPAMVIFKERDRSSDWYVWHQSVCDADTKFLKLNTTDALQSGAGDVWGDLPTENVININNGSLNATGSDNIAYCFADVPGYQRIGKYNGTGSTQTIVCGFKPKFVMVKNITVSNDNWYIFDSERLPNTVWANGSNAESSSYAAYFSGFANDGFTVTGSNQNTNSSSHEYIFWAIGDDEIGSDEDCLVDVPNAVTADADATDTTGGYQRGNYATLNSLQSGSNVTLSNGNLVYTSSAAATHTNKLSFSTIGVSSGKWYAEATCTAKNDNFYIGVMGNVSENFVASSGTSLGFYATGWGYWSDGDIYNNGSVIDSAPAGIAAGETVGVALDVDNRTVTFYKNGVQQGSTATSLTADATWMFAVAAYKDSTIAWNFGQMRFKYPIPSGYAALNTTALPAATIEDGSAYFDTVLWTGDSASPRSITGLEFSPDLVYSRPRNNGRSPIFYDAVRGAGKKLYSNLTDAEDTSTGRGYLSSFDSNGFTLTDGSAGDQDSNSSGYTYVGWAWDAGSSTVSNTDGSQTTSVRANAAAGFSIVEGANMTSSQKTFGHGLNAAPEMIIGKRIGAAEDWNVYHKDLTSNKMLTLNTTSAEQNSNFSGTPTSSVFTYYPNADSYIFYCFAPVAGYSAIGSYTGNGSDDGPFVFTGMRPSWLLVKRSSSTGNWILVDTTRSPFNTADDILIPNSNVAEQDLSAYTPFDILSNGFKLRDGTDLTGTTNINVNGSTYIYVAFAENPFSANGGLAR